MTQGQTVRTMRQMRTLAACLALTLAACGEDPTDPVGLDGEWSVTWACDLGCEQAPPSLVNAETLTVGDDEVTWARAWDDRIDLVHVGVRDGDCLAVPFGDDDTIGRGRDPYVLCASGVAVAAVIREHDAAGTVQVQWAAAGAR